MRCRLGSRRLGIHTVQSLMNQVVVDAVFHKTSGILGVEQTGVIGFILDEQQLGIVLAVKPALAVVVVIERNSRYFRARIAAQARPARIQTPSPGVAKPNGWNEMQR